MSRDVGDVIGEALGRVARETAQTISSNAQKAQKVSNGHLSGPMGLAAGAGLVALAPLAIKAGKLAGRAGGQPVTKARDAVSGTVKNAVDQKVNEAGGVGGVAKEAGKSMIPGVGGDSGGGGSNGSEGVPKGRQMPIQQSIDIALPLSDVYNAWTQFEDWPEFMHRLDRVTQEDDSHVSFKTKIWGFSREFKAEIVEQRPDDRIKWRVTEGVSHSGVVSFHQIADRLTRVDVDITVHPGSLIEKAARGMRHAKRAVRADLARFKAHVEIDQDETGEWRGVIEDGDVKSSRSSSRGSGGSGSSGRASSRRSASPSSGRSSSSRSTGGSGRSSSSRSSSGGSGGSGRPSSGSAKSRSSSSRSSGSSDGRSRSSSSRSRSSSNGRSGSGSTRPKASSRS